MNDLHTTDVTKTDALAGVGPVGNIVPRVEIRIRLAVEEDVPAIDRLQKLENRALGFLHFGTLKGKIARKEIVVAEVGNLEKTRTEESINDQQEAINQTSHRSSSMDDRSPIIGYLIASDRYARRDELGIITQMNVHRDYRRSLVAGALLEYQFNRVPEGCKLYCCWCAQDLEGNRFWESMGFSPIAFRTGSLTKGKTKDGKSTSRPHIFWMRRVRMNDETTPMWFPNYTQGGALGDDRPIFPIPEGVNWWDEMPEVLPPEAHAYETVEVGASDETMDDEARARGETAHRAVKGEKGAKGQTKEEAKKQASERVSMRRPVDAQVKFDATWVEMVRRMNAGEVEMPAAYVGRPAYSRREKEEEKARRLEAKRAMEDRLKQLRAEIEAKEQNERGMVLHDASASTLGASASTLGAAGGGGGVKKKAKGRKRVKLKMTEAMKQATRLLRDRWVDEVGSSYPNAWSRHEIGRVVVREKRAIKAQPTLLDVEVVTRAA